MFKLRDRVLIKAPIERCFALSTSVPIVEKELGMHPVAGRTTGCVRGGDTVRWEGWQLGFRNFHVSLISEFDEPWHFQDRMLEGRFQSFAHDHWFREVDGGVQLEDEVRFTMPFGWAGYAVGHMVLVPHIRMLLRGRFAILKELAEGEGWRSYACDDPTPSLQP